MPCNAAPYVPIRPRLDGEKLEVVQTLQRVGDALRLVPPKTEDSARTVPLPLPRVEAFREHRKNNSPNAPTPGRTGRNTVSSFPHAAELRWNPTISAGAVCHPHGCRARPDPVS
jgi:hypothetical protein